ncbi:MAG: DNA internalization-related competence protein ComEC/Rec2 [Anaerolineaceae bacterium]|nr:DNA internalization-related competence protein ComEC/Rec2 [Anaerolineaceae bacterium]
MPLAVALVTGILVGRLAGGSPWPWVAACAVALLLLIVSLCRPARLWKRLGTLAALLLWVSLGASWIVVCARLSPRDVSRAALSEGRLVTVEGTLIESPRQSRRPDNPLLLQGDDVATYTGMFLNASALTMDGRRQDVSGRLRVIVSQPLPQEPAARPRTGDRLKIVGLLRPIGGPLNPGQADIRDIYSRRGIRARLSTSYWEAVHRQRPPWWNPYGWMGAIRYRLRQTMPQDDSFAGRIMPALFLGDRTELSDGEEQSFIQAGVLHYLAVSGLHVALLSGLLIGAMRLLLVPHRVRAIVLIAFIVAYALATELRPSVVRAGVFFLLLCGSWLLGRRRDMLNTLAAATMVVLLLNPADLFQSGFQLSFLVACGLIVVYPRLYARLFPTQDWQRLIERSRLGQVLWRLRRRMAQMIAIGLTAWVFATPIAAWHYHIVAPVGVVGTILVFPLVFLLLVCGALACATALVPGLPAAPAIAIMQWLSRLLGQVVGLLARLPFGHFYVRQFAWPWAAMTLGLLLVWSQRRRWRIARWQVAAAMAVLLLGYICFGIPRGPHDQVRITTLAVGSGNAVLVQGPHRYSLLVDCGSSLLAEHTGRTVTVPALWKLGVGRLDGVVLTHADADHLKDLPVVLQKIPTRRVYLSRHFLTDRKSYDDRVLAWLQKQDLDIRYVASGDTIAAPGGVTIDVLGPPSEMLPSSSTNATSIVLKVGYQGRSMILTGDATPDRLAAMSREWDIRTDVLLLPHHGQRSPEVLDFLARSGSQIAVMSVGRYRDTNRRGKFYWPKDAELLKTYRRGAVAVILEAGGVRAETFQKHDGRLPVLP